MQSLVTLVSNINDEIIKIRPKIEIIQQEEAIVEEHYDEKLPQTGIIDWPIPILAIGGILIFAIGWYLIFVKSKKTKIGIILTAIAIIMVVLAGGILIYNNKEDKRVKEENQKVIEILEKK